MYIILLSDFLSSGLHVFITISITATVTKELFYFVYGNQAPEATWEMNDIICCHVCLFFNLRISNARCVSAAAVESRLATNKGRALSAFSQQETLCTLLFTLYLCSALQERLGNINTTF